MSPGPTNGKSTELLLEQILANQQTTNEKIDELADRVSKRELASVSLRARVQRLEDDVAGSIAGDGLKRRVARMETRFAWAAGAGTICGFVGSGVMWMLDHIFLPALRRAQ